MKLRLLVPALALGLLSMISTTAKAQVGLYLNPVVSRIGISTADYGPYSFLGDGQTSRFFGGVDFGGYYDFFHQPGFVLGTDIRETILHGNNADLSTFSVAARIAALPTKHGFRPYGEVSVGAGRSKAEESTLRVTKTQFGILAGVDYPIAKHVDFRVLELGYGQVTTISSQIERDNTSIPAAQLFTISTGLVFRFGK